MRNKNSNVKELKTVRSQLIKENNKINVNIKKYIYIIIFISCLIAVISFGFWYKSSKDAKLTDATNGKYELYTETQGYVLNKETIVQYNKNETLVPIAESEKRITINSVVGIYKNAEYNNSLSELDKMDDEINQKIKLLPDIYSSEVISIDREIDAITKKMKNISSYIEIGDYKTKLDTLAYNKAVTISSLTPSGTDIQTLIAKRDEYKENMNKSSNNVKAPISGIIVYKNDGLENKFDLTNIDKFTNEDIEKIITEYNKIKEETFGIKIVDNYESYIVIKEDKTNDKYITENKSYTIELLDKDIKIRGTLIKKISNDNTNYCIFKITNNIEDLVDLRQTDIKVIWKELNGFVVSNTSIKSVNNIEYVTILSLNKYIDIPVKNLLKLENVSLVRNYTDSEKTDLSLTETRNLVVYDRVVENKE